MKALVGALNQEKALVGAFSVIIHHRRLIVYSTSLQGRPRLQHQRAEAAVPAGRLLGRGDGAHAAAVAPPRHRAARPGRAAAPRQVGVSPPNSSALL